ncbi:hypothetical protein Mal4_56950 [Maioricimonas rarisocia]|uniref:Uncharacterized protein n=1 Tax=Maioricimonas rarisocia TaxID=2528026 RepID=A0A517ZFW3_9PLAN|nr:hypothetical protein [Maioricimonas rarisocia]QDU41329.1 hypothetical protein Mal4_56950 [Maioricimonas rarisocia]
MPVSSHLRPKHAALIGAISGGLLLMFAVIADWERATRSPDEAWHEALPLGPAIIGACAGAFLGGLFGVSAWLLLAGGRIHPLYLALAGGIVAAVVCTPLHFWYWNLDAPSEEGSGMGPAFHAMGVARLYLHVVLPGSTAAGMVLGASLGIIRWRRNRG